MLSDVGSAEADLGTGVDQEGDDREAGGGDGEAAGLEGIGREVEVKASAGGGAEEHRRGGAGDGEGGSHAGTVGWRAVEGEIPSARGEGGGADDVLGAINHVEEEGCVVVVRGAGRDRGQGGVDGGAAFRQRSIQSSSEAAYTHRCTVLVVLSVLGGGLADGEGRGRGIGGDGEGRGRGIGGGWGSGAEAAGTFAFAFAVAVALAIFVPEGGESGMVGGWNGPRDIMV